MKNEDLILELINKLDTNQFNLFLKLYNQIYNSRNDKEKMNILHKDISQICLNRLRTEDSIKKNFKTIGGIPLLLQKWWYK